jgi:hypothetical protein
MKPIIVALMLFMAFMPVAYADVPTLQEKQEVITQRSTNDMESKLLTEVVLKNHKALVEYFDKSDADFATKCIREYLELFYKDREKIVKLLEEQGCREDFISFVKERPDKAFIFIRAAITDCVFELMKHYSEEDFEAATLLKVTEYIKVGHGTMYFDKPENKLTETDKKMREIADDITVKDLVAYRMYNAVMINYVKLLNDIFDRML